MVTRSVPVADGHAEPAGGGSATGTARDAQSVRDDAPVIARLPDDLISRLADA